jgi:Protein of unknown function (DUF2786)
MCTIDVHETFAPAFLKGTLTMRATTITKKIRALLDKTVANGAEPAEADSALQMAIKLMTKHGLTFADFGIEPPAAQEPEPTPEPTPEPVAEPAAAAAEPTPATDAAPAAEPAAAEPKKSKKPDFSHIDWPAIAARYRSGERLTAIGLELGLSWNRVWVELDKVGVDFTTESPKHIAQKLKAAAKAAAAAQTEVAAA